MIVWLGCCAKTRVAPREGSNKQRPDCPGQLMNRFDKWEGESGRKCREQYSKPQEELNLNQHDKLMQMLVLNVEMTPEGDL